jgi:hypothetical protein
MMFLATYQHFLESLLLALILPEMIGDGKVMAEITETSQETLSKLFKLIFL